MNTLLRGAVIVSIFMLANVVAAGVISVLGPHFVGLDDGPLKILAIIVLGILAVGCALAFLKGCLSALSDRLQYRRGHRGG